MMDKKIKLIMLLLASFAFLIFGAYFVSKNIIKPRATQPKINLAIYPSNTTFSPEEEKEFQVVATFLDGGNLKLTYAKFVIQFPRNRLELSDYVWTPDNFRQIRVDGMQAANSSGRIIVRLGAISLDQAPPLSGSLVLARIKFRAKQRAGGEGEIRFVRSNLEFVHSGEQNIQVGSVQGSRVSFESSGGQSPSPTPTNTPTPTPPPTGGQTREPSPTPTQPPGSAPTSSPTTAPTPTPTQQPSGGGGAGTGGSTTFRILVKFQGISGLPKSGVRELPVKIGLQRVGSRNIMYKTVNFRAKEGGVWEGQVAYNIPTNLYFIFIKGPKHIGKKICEERPREGYPGAYRCPQARAIRLESGRGYNFDFTGITLLVGDLPEQDGLVNAYDLSLVRNLLGKTDADSLAKADVNLDGVVDTQDFALIQAALSVRYDDY